MKSKVSHRAVIARTLVAVVAMFAFGFALVPLYDVLCDITGLNGRIDLEVAETVEAADVDYSRLVTVEFVANRNSYLPWEFNSTVSKLEVHPGQMHTVQYYAKNLQDRPMVGRAVPSVAPGTASKYLHKVECFCFTEQAFNASESKYMPVQFYIDPDLPKSVDTVTLAYTFFDATEEAKVSLRD